MNKEIKLPIYLKVIFISCLIKILITISLIIWVWTSHSSIYELFQFLSRPENLFESIYYFLWSLILFIPFIDVPIISFVAYKQYKKKSLKYLFYSILKGFLGGLVLLLINFLSILIFIRL